MTVPSNYTTAELIRARQAMDRPVAALRDAFFSGRHFSTTSDIAIDQLIRKRTMAPYVSPLVKGKVQKLRGGRVNRFKAPYVKPKATIDPEQSVVRSHGEDFGAPLTPQQRFDALVVQELADQEDQITRREEKQAAEVLTLGKVVVSGEDHEAYEVDYQRDASLTTALTGGARWGETGVNPLTVIRSQSKLVAQKSGATVTDVVLGTSATEIFQDDATISDKLDNRRQANGTFQLGALVIGADDNPMSYLGTIGSVDYWAYAGTYEDEDGNTLEFVDEHGMILIGRASYDAMMAYGAILDRKSPMVGSRFPKMWDEEDPANTNVMTQSAPLAVPADANASSYVEVR